MLGVIFIWGIGPILDVALGESKNPRPPRESGTPFEALLWVHGLLHFVMLGTFFVFAASEGMTRWLSSRLAVYWISCSGISHRHRT